MLPNLRLLSVITIIFAFDFIFILRKKSSFFLSDILEKAWHFRAVDQ